MPPEPEFRNDKLEFLVRKCIVFPANGSETCIVPMVARTVTTEDTSLLRLHSRCVDMASTFGDDYRKTQVMAHKTRTQSTYLFFYNLSPNLPVNLDVARVIRVTPSHLKIKRRLFWRGDVVAMKVQPESEKMALIVEILDADLSELRDLEEVLQRRYQEGYLDRLLHFDENQWNSYLACFRGPTSLLLGAPKSYWGTNAAEKEENFLHDLNELRWSIGPPFPRHIYMKSFTEHAVTLYATFKSALSLHQKVTELPKLPPELERQIFEMCALESPEICPVLVLVAKRVYEWIDPILIATVCIREDFESKRWNMLERFLAKLTDGKPVEYYTRHIKNLAIFVDFVETEPINPILAICTGVERLTLITAAGSFNFFENPQAGRNLRRLTVDLWRFLPTPRNFYHACFTNITHLHLLDEDAEWPTYTGWENLTSLTHLAFACSGTPEQVMQVMQTLPTVRYVALGDYRTGKRYRYSDPTIDNSPHMREAWGIRIVVLSYIPECDWERGVRGEGDFWDLVEQEVQRRLEEVDSVD